VVFVPAAALEEEGGAGDELLDLMFPAAGAVGQGIIGHLLEGLELMSTVRTAILVDGHTHRSIGAAAAGERQTPGVAYAASP